MRKLLLILSIFAFTNLSYGQAISIKEASKSVETITKTNSKEVQKQIQNGLTSNDELAAMGADYLKGNSDTQSDFYKLLKDNKGSVNLAMKAVMNNPKLKSSVMDYITANPEIMTKALGMLGM
tara:strand:- start:172 stop:540 length:369 start_codon:yes stop_codon:yes gene_type:complete